MYLLRMEASTFDLEKLKIGRNRTKLKIGLRDVVLAITACQFNLNVLNRITEQR